MKPQSSNQSAIVGLLDIAFARREPLRRITDALRLVNSAGDNLPGIVIEQYSRHFVIHDYRKAPESTLQTVIDHLRSRFDPEYLIVKQRLAEGGKEHDSRSVRVVIDRGDSRTIVTEYGLKLQVDLNDTLNTGLFLDMRKNRKRIAELSPHKEVLNCFAYSCSFGVHCRAAQASRVVNVDVSTKILDKGRRNYELNGLVPHEHEFVYADTLRYLKGAAKRDNRFDCIILDPPTFARHEKTVFSITKALPQLLTLSLSVLKPGGHILVATNCSAISPDTLMGELQAASKHALSRVDSATRLTQDQDFPGSGTMKESFLSCILAKISRR